MVVSSLLFSCSVSRWLSSVLSTSGLSNTGQKGIVVVGVAYMRGLRKDGVNKNACLLDATFSHIRLSLVSSSNCVACISLSFLLKYSSLI